MRESRYTPSPCLNCGKLLDAAVNADGATPSDTIARGATPISICFHCGHVMALTAELKHRALTSEEMHDLAGNKELLMMLDVAARVRKEKKDAG